ncbi:hypothetical protein ACFQL4_06165 [Halosimplex aquaticum]
MFNEHARDRHEVVLERDAPADDVPVPESTEETTESQTTASSASNGRNAMDG